jgi:hypothetical protein
MSVVTLSPNYVRKIAKTYKLLRAGEPADAKVLETFQAAADRCLKAHMRASLQLTPDVKLPMAAVLMMLEYVRSECTARLEPVPQPEDLAPMPLTPERLGFLRAAVQRLQALVAA